MQEKTAPRPEKEPCRAFVGSIGQTLSDRGRVYGRFEDHAALSQSLKRTMQRAPGWQALADDQREALEMAQHKIARVLNGSPDYIDSWRDAIGYMQLVVDRLAETDGATDARVQRVVRRGGAWL